MEFIDGICEGDGTHIICCWRFFLPLFRASECTNYGIETVNLLDQHDFLFTPRIKQQLVWKHTVNTHGKPEKNIPCDLHMEPLIRECKSSIGSLGSNITERSIDHVGKCIGPLFKITQQFDDVNGVKSDW